MRERVLDLLDDVWYLAYMEHPLVGRALGIVKRIFMFVLGGICGCVTVELINEGLDVLAQLMQ